MEEIFFFFFKHSTPIAPPCYPMSITTQGASILQPPSMIPANTLPAPMIGQTTPAALTPVPVTTEDISKLKLALSQVTT